MVKDAAAPAVSSEKELQELEHQFSVDVSWFFLFTNYFVYKFSLQLHLFVGSRSSKVRAAYISHREEGDN